MNNDKLTPHDTTNEQGMSKSKLKRLVIQQATNEQVEQYSETAEISQEAWDKLGSDIHKNRTKQSEQGDWVMVPREPTEGMVKALRTGSRADYPSDELCKVRYTAMLSASPKPSVEDDRISQLEADKAELLTALKDALDIVEGEGNWPGTARHFDCVIAKHEGVK